MVLTRPMFCTRSNVSVTPARIGKLNRQSGTNPGYGKDPPSRWQDNYTEIASGLSLPTAMTFGPDENLYVSNWGFGPPPVGIGQVLKVIVPAN